METEAIQALLGTVSERMSRSDIACQKCGGMLWLYHGESVREWDVEWCEYADSFKGQTLPCPECRKRYTILMNDCGSIMTAQRLADEEAPDKVPEKVFQAARERRVQMVERLRASFNKNCEDWKYPASMIHERWSAWRKRIFDHMNTIR